MKPIAFNYENFSALQEENLYLVKSVAELARESVEREKALARLEAEVVAAIEPKRGEWIRMDETQALLSVEWKCSQCGQEIRVDGILTAIGTGWKYCPNCGADMRRESEVTP